MLVIHGKDSAIVLSVETEGRTVDATSELPGWFYQINHDIGLMKIPSVHVIQNI